MEERLRKFAALVELGSFTKAAESLHVSQPALSTSIKKLERELKEQLLLRGTQPLALTPAGEHAYRAAKEIHVSTSNLTNKLEQLRQQKPTVSVGMIDSVAQAVFSYGTAFSELEQNAHVSLIVDNSRNLPAAVRQGELDMAFVVEPSMRSAEEPLRYRSVGSEPLVAVCRKNELPALQAALARGQLSPFISYDRSSNTYRLIAQTYTEAHIRLRPTFYSTSPSVMLQLAAAGRGAAVLPYLLVQDMLADQVLCRLPIAGALIIERPIACVTQQGRELPLLLETASAEVGETLKELRTAALQIDK
jgi:DNA-binding transcriptional LysR family regulator